MTADRISIMFCAVIPPLIAVAVITQKLVLLIAVIAVAIIALFVLGRAIAHRDQSGAGREHRAEATR